MFICPKCGKEVTSLIYPTNPPKTGKKCFGCGWTGNISSYHFPDQKEDLKIVAE